MIEISAPEEWEEGWTEAYLDDNAPLVHAVTRCPYCKGKDPECRQCIGQGYLRRWVPVQELRKDILR